MHPPNREYVVPFGLFQVSPGRFGFVVCDTSRNPSLVSVHKVLELSESFVI